MTPTIWEGTDAFLEIKAPWQGLFERCSDAPVFLSWEWASNWWAHFHRENRLRLTTLSDGDELLCLAPLIARTDVGQLRLIGSEETTDYADLLAEGSMLPSVSNVLFDYWSERADDLVLEPLAEESQLLQTFRVRAATGLPGTAQRLETCPTVQLPSSWDDYLASLRKTDRHELRRKIRRAESAGALSYEVLREPDRVEGALETFFRLHQSSGDPRKAHFLQPHIRAFFTDVSLAFAERGWLRLAMLRFDEIPIATVLSFHRGGAVQLYNSGYDPHYRPISPGIVLLAYELRSAIEEGHTQYDFLRGDEPYKYDFGAQDRFVWRICLGKTEAACSGPDLAGAP